MRVELTIALDIPGAEELSDAELRQAIFDFYTNYVTLHHLEDALNWTVSRGKYESAGDMTMTNVAERVALDHKTWSDISKNAEMIRIERV